MTAGDCAGLAVVRSVADDVVEKALGAAFREAWESDAPLNARLDIYANALRKSHIVFAEAVDRLVQRLAKVDAGSGAPGIGERMPPFLLPDDEGRLISLDALLTDGPVAIVFHRGHWCPYCRLTARALAELDSSIKSTGGQVVAITPELQHYTRRHRQEAGAAFRFLSDIQNGYALSLNLAIWVGEELKSVMIEFGRDLLACQGNASWILPIPATFVVAPSGVIVARFVDPDYRRRVDLDDMLAALAAAGRK